MGKHLPKRLLGSWEGTCVTTTLRPALLREAGDPLPASVFLPRIPPQTHTSLSPALITPDKASSGGRIPGQSLTC